MDDFTGAEPAYVPPYVRELMQGASEEDILAAAENLRAYVLIMYNATLRMAEEGTLDAALEAASERLNEACADPLCIWVRIEMAVDEGMRRKPSSMVQATEKRLLVVR